MDSIYKRLELQGADHKCFVCMGSGVWLCRVDWIIKEEMPCEECHGTGLDFEFEEEMHRKVFYQVLNIFHKAIKKHETEEFTEEDFENVTDDLANILQLVPAINTYPHVVQGYTMLTLEHHGIIFSTDKILAVF